MRTTIVIGMLAMVALTVPVDAASNTPANTQGGCNNNGVIIMQGIGNSYECESIIQFCHQGTGAGAGAGAGGPGQNEAGAQASAGTSCSASTGDDDCDDGGEVAALRGVSAVPAPGTAGLAAWHMAGPGGSTQSGDDCDDEDPDGGGDADPAHRTDVDGSPGAGGDVDDGPDHDSTRIVVVAPHTTAESTPGSVA